MSPTPVAAATDSSSHVDVTVPLRAEFASIVRLVAASLGADAGFSVDDIDDLRLAMSEVFSSLVDGSVDGNGSARVDITFDTAGPGLAVTLARTRDANGDEDGVGDFELDELATSIIRVAVDEFDVVDGAVRLVKRRVEQTADQSAR